jgi:hypothetical protein
VTLAEERLTAPTADGTAPSPGHRPAGLGDAGIGRAAIAGAAVGYVVALTIVATILVVAGAGLLPALGVGAFVAIWGGPGFGGMVAAQRYADRIADEERRDRAAAEMTNRPVAVRAMAPPAAMS